MRQIAILFTNAVGDSVPFCSNVIHPFQFGPLAPPLIPGPLKPGREPHAASPVPPPFSGSRTSSVSPPHQTPRYSPGERDRVMVFVAHQSEPISCGVARLPLLVDSPLRLGSAESISLPLDQGPLIPGPSPHKAVQSRGRREPRGPRFVPPTDLSGILGTVPVGATHQIPPRRRGTAPVGATHLYLRLPRSVQATVIGATHQSLRLRALGFGC